MVSRSSRFLTILGVAVILSACTSARASDSSTATAGDSTTVAVRAAISAAWHDHIEAAKQKDVVGVAAMYADDAVYIVPGLREVHGRPAIDEMEAQSLAEADVLGAVHTILDLRIFDDVAYEIGTVEGPVRSEGEPAQTVAFHFMAMWQRNANGAWRIRYLVGQS